MEKFRVFPLFKQFTLPYSLGFSFLYGISLFQSIVKKTIFETIVFLLLAEERRVNLLISFLSLKTPSEVLTGRSLLDGFRCKSHKRCL